jgi:alpha-L-fucosidase 2
MKRRHFLKLLSGIATLWWRPRVSFAEPSSQLEGANERLWFRQPARYWNSQSLHLGNGSLGASFWGGVSEERIDLTERSLWTGGPGENPQYRYGIREGGRDHLKKIRELIQSGEIDRLKEADALVSEHFLGDGAGFGAFSSFGRLFLETGAVLPQPDEYVRALDLATGIGSVRFVRNGNTQRREYFCSYPHRVMVIRIENDSPGAVHVKTRWDLLQKNHRIEVEGDTVQVTGTVNGNGRAFSITMRVLAEGGRVERVIGGIEVFEANAVTILIAAGTEYDADASGYGGRDALSESQGQCARAAAIPYSELRAAHIADYQHFYRRVSLSVAGNPEVEAIPTDARWHRYCAKKGDDPGFKVLYFNLGRYLLISSSRPGGLPNTLQGGWNCFEEAPWSGNYQSNINLQLSYSGAAITNLLECQEPYIAWTKHLVKPGREVAQSYYGTPGWVSHSIGNIWGYAAPGSEITWGMYPAGAAWHCHTLWEHYVYGRDKDYLRSMAYPVMKEAAEFWLDNLVPYENGLISAPSVSAEHGASVVNGRLQALGSSFDAEVNCVPGCYQDIEIVRDLLANVIAAARVLNVDEAFVELVSRTKDRLLPFRTGRFGQLQEWAEDIDSPECNHRHISHTWAVWPGRQITPSATPLLAAAAKRTLELRGEAACVACGPGKDIHTAGNWSLANRAACWIRLLDGERANAILTKLVTEAGFENLCTYQHVPKEYSLTGDSAANDLSTESTASQKLVWQVDASMAMPGLLAEMLLQMDGEMLHLLPALPKEWAKQGWVRGLRAPGGLSVDISWRNGKVRRFSVVGDGESTLPVRVNGRIRRINASRESEG